LLIWSTGVKVTMTVSVPPAVAVTEAWPDAVEEMITLAMPPMVLAVGALSMPSVVPKVTRVPSATGLPYASVTVAWSVEVATPSAGSVAGMATNTTFAASPTKGTLTLPKTAPAVPVTVAIPADVEESNCTCAMPPTVVALGALSVPRVVINVTSVPSGTGFPPASRTSAVIVVHVVPSAGIVGGAALRLMLAGGGGGGGVGVRVLVGVGDGVNVAVGVGVGVPVGVGVRVGLGVTLGVGVPVGVGVEVNVGMGVCVAVGSGVEVDVGTGVCVAVGGGSVAVGLGVCVAVGVARATPCRVGVAVMYVIRATTATLVWYSLTRRVVSTWTLTRYF
jgi:hypothetical protein